MEATCNTLLATVERSQRLRQRNKALRSRNRHDAAVFVQTNAGIPFGECHESPDRPFGGGLKTGNRRKQCSTVNETNGEKARSVETHHRLLAREKLRRACAVEESSATVAR